MKRIYLWMLSLCPLLILSCKEEATADEDAWSVNSSPCQRQPAFLPSTGLNPKAAAFSTSERNTKGLVLKEVNAAATDTVKKWQHPSWGKYGWMGPITTDDNGNAYTVPVPVINLLYNPIDKQNIIYKVDSRTAAMQPLTELPVAERTATENVFGLLGIYFDCSTQKLYAASIAASTRDKERGILYLIDPADGKILDEWKGHDAMGLCVAGITGEKRLYYGSSRSSDIYSIKVTAEGKFSGEARKECSLDLLGPRGDDKARRIRFDKNGVMLVHGVEFNYNLTAPTERQETVYKFRYSEEEKKWGYEL